MSLEINKIYCEDNVKFMKDNIPDDFIDLTVTSPPYDNLRKYNGYSWNFEGVTKELYRITKDGGVVVWIVGDATIKGSETGTSFRQALYFKEIGFNLHDTMIYQKNSSSPNVFQKRYIQSFEYMFVFVKGFPVKTFNPLMRPNKNARKQRKAGSKMQRNGELKTYGKNSSPIIHEQSKRSNIWVFNTGSATGDDKISFKHPAPFPEQLAYEHIVSWSNEDDLVFDPFCGSGTTCKMSILNNRNFIGIDVSQEYCDIANQRIASSLCHE